MIDRRRRIAAHESMRWTGVPAATVRVWAYRGRLHSVGLDTRGYPLYRVVDVIALRNMQGVRRVP